jgi:sugar (pentulose or hexulose) kinase
MDVVVAIDIGTSETKCSLVDREGRVVARAAAGYPLLQDGPRHEQRPDDWWRAAQEALRSALAGAAARPAAVVLRRRCAPPSPAPRPARPPWC